MRCTGKWAAVAGVIAGIALCGITPQAALVTVSVEPSSYAPGDAGIAYITLQNSAGITGADLSLRLPDCIVPAAARTTGESADFRVASQPRPGGIEIGIASSTGLLVDRAVVLRIPFKVRTTAEAGDHIATFDHIQLYDLTPNPTSSQAVGAALAVLPPRADDDNDGLPDDWEILHFGSTQATGTGDSDFDGFDDLREFVAGTDPTKGDSFLAIDQITVAHDVDAVTLRWTAQQNRTYSIEWSDDLLGPGMNWHPVYNPQIRVNGGGAQWIDDGSRTYSFPSASHQRFYRIRTELP